MTGVLSWYMPLVIWDTVVVSPGIQGAVLPVNKNITFELPKKGLLLLVYGAFY